MPIEGITWSQRKRAIEVHVLENTSSPDLRIAHLLFFTRDAHNDLVAPAAKQYLDPPSPAPKPNDVTLTFTIADASVDPGKSTRTLPGVKTLDGATGAVTTDQTLPARFPQNFLLEVQAVSEPNTPREITFRELIRIYLHRSIQEIWLTPNPLTVRPRRSATFPTTTNSRFALRARFDDDSVGDITDWPGVQWGPAASVDSQGRLIVNAGDSQGPMIQITARLPAYPSVATATADLRVVDAWRPENPIGARLIPGGGWSKPFAIEAVPNVLFLSDGFTLTGKEKFYKYVNALITFAKTDPLCKPFDILANSINFWAAFIPPNTTTAKAGITWGSDVFVTPLGPRTVPPPARPQEMTAEDSLELDHLIYEIGLPSPRDRSANTTRSDAAIFQDLDALFGTKYKTLLPPKEPDRTQRFQEWRMLGNHRILDDLDTPLGMMSGAPRVDFGNDTIKLNPDRMDRDRLNDLMSALQDENAASGLIISSLWTDQRKRNYDLVCLITSGMGRELNSFGYFTLSQFQLVFGSVSNVNDITIQPMPMIDKLDRQAPRVFVHELSHSFDLGDEYSGKNDQPLFPVRQAWEDRVHGNLQSSLTIQRAGVIHGDEIKWRWHRIRWAAEIIGSIEDKGGGIFEAPIRTRHAFAFPIGQIMHLRFRNIDYAYRDVQHDNVHFDDDSSYLVKEPLLSVPLKLVDKFERGTPAVYYVRLAVDSTAQFSYPQARTVPPDRIVATFTPGSIVYCPTRAPAGVFHSVTYPYAELIAKSVKDHITSIHKVIGHPNPGRTLPEISLLPKAVLPPDFSSKSIPFIVGLYEGGVGNMKGMVHATGDCMMNGTRTTRYDPSDPEQGATRYCHVCRYVLVDAIDPSKHYFLDPDYTQIYPQK